MVTAVSDTMIVEPENNTPAVGILRSMHTSPHTPERPTHPSDPGRTNGAVKSNTSNSNHDDLVSSVVQMNLSQSSAASAIPELGPSLGSQPMSQSPPASATTSPVKPAPGKGGFLQKTRKRNRKLKQALTRYQKKKTFSRPKKNRSKKSKPLRYKNKYIK
jgi:hypothetical protein